MLFVILFAYRRAQWIGMIFSLSLLYLGAAKPVRRRLAIVLMASLCTGSALAVATGLSQDKLTRIASRLSSVFDRNQHSNVYHRLESQVTLRDLSKSPLLGMGMGGCHSRLPGYNIDVVPTNVVHNTFLYIWMKTGLPGLLFFLWAAWLYAQQVLRVRRDHPQDTGQNLLLPLAASSGLWLAMFLTGPTLWYFHQTFLLALFAAIGMSLVLQADNNSKMQPGVAR
jgi:O-antigen ligase